MINIFSVYSATIGGRLKEVKDQKTDAKGNSYCMFLIDQANVYHPDSVITHWVKAWGSSKVKQIREFPVGHNILVDVNGSPYTGNGKDGQVRTNMQLQATNIVYAGISSDGGGQSQSSSQDASPKQQADMSTDNVPF